MKSLNMSTQVLETQNMKEKNMKLSNKKMKRVPQHKQRK